MSPSTPAAWDIPADAIRADAPESFLEASASEDGRASLVYFLVNVGDGDMQLILLPEQDQQTAPARGRRALVVDAATTRKLPGLLAALDGKGVIDLDARFTAGPLFAIVVGTHPHGDHIGGIPEFLHEFHDRIDEYWEPGYYHPSAGYIETMVALEDYENIRRVQPTSGTTSQVGDVRITVLAPGIGLRNRFDSYGTLVNDASIALKIEFPVNRVFAVPEGEHQNRIYRKGDPWSLILGADAQTTAWAQTLIDFPQLHRDHSAEVYGALRKSMGDDALRAHVFKVPHHASKHGLNIELVERVKPNVALVSSVGGGGKYNFPHMLAVESIREALQSTTSRGEKRLPDYELGIHYTCAESRVRPRGRRRPLGTIAIMVPPRRGRMRMWRFGDRPQEPVNLERAVEMAYLRKSRSGGDSDDDEG